MVLYNSASLIIFARREPINNKILELANHDSWPSELPPSMRVLQSLWKTESEDAYFGNPQNSKSMHSFSRRCIFSVDFPIPTAQEVSMVSTFQEWGAKIKRRM